MRPRAGHDGEYRFYINGTGATLPGRVRMTDRRSGQAVERTIPASPARILFQFAPGTVLTDRDSVSFELLDGAGAGALSDFYVYVYGIGPASAEAGAVGGLVEIGRPVPFGSVRADPLWAVVAEVDALVLQFQPAARCGVATLAGTSLPGVVFELRDADDPSVSYGTLTDGAVTYFTAFPAEGQAPVRRVQLILQSAPGVGPVYGIPASFHLALAWQPIE